MNKTFSITIDADDERRRALAKVYSLLLQIAEKVEEQKLSPSKVDSKSTGDGLLAHLETSTKEGGAETNN
jgi:hypothetical protein